MKSPVAGSTEPVGTEPFDFKGILGAAGSLVQMESGK